MVGSAVIPVRQNHNRPCAGTYSSSTSSIRLRRFLRALAILATLLAASAALALPPPEILVLSVDPHNSKGLLEFELSLRRHIADTSWKDALIDVEHLDVVYSGAPELRQTMEDLLRAKYYARPPAVIIAVGADALRFLRDVHSEIFPGVPVVACHLLRSDAQAYRWENVAGVVSDWDFMSEGETALRLLPGTERLVMILGSGPVERFYEPEYRREMLPLKRRVQLEWWVGVPQADLEKRVARLPRNSAVIYISLYRDDAGGTYLPTAAVEKLGRVSSAPIFGIYSHQVGRGIVGDGRVNPVTIGDQVGTLTTRILHGESAAAVGFQDLRVDGPFFDARELDRWNISRSRLPPGSRILFEKPSLWREHRVAVLVGLSIIILQGLLLMVVLAARVERARAERSENESKNLYKSVADSLDERLAIIARDGTIISANHAWEEFSAAPGREPFGVGKNYLHGVTEALDRGREDARRTLDSLAAVLSGDEKSHRLEYFSPAGGDRWRYEMRIVSLQRGDGAALVTIQDITDRWRSEERVRVTLESLPLATVLLEASGPIELVNKAAEELFGYPRAELIGRPLETLIPQFEKGARSFVTFPLLAEGNVMGRRRDGKEVPLQLHLRVIEMASRTMILASIMDMSERRRLDGEVTRLREETAHFGRVMTLGEMSAAIAHELNQPLTGIMTNCQAAQRLMDHSSFSQAEVLETFSDIVADTRRAGEVIQRLRVLLRKTPTEVRPLNVNEIVKQVQHLVAHDLALRGAAMDLEMAEDLPLVSADRIHLQQVILNLILNAADAMGDLPAEARRMVLRTGPGMNRTVELQLRDFGPGISAEVMPHMFEPFFTTKANGMGMGLSIVRSIIETHGGRITCANAGSGGAIFTVKLPAVEREAA
jgi:two-component system sensor kinase FixL